ncbi:Atxe2 family lasso peptide isopeptidase [Hephaestia mangrovi]|uniref:Atxe2 family lasso peptide isopeptidase n=1 Tax=Hephaestia mangrovi TaxID=2873268 RepID=UPI001CA788A8|nr:Atxe2 family lasso peptide isopeptidase [Hephaestia mangrovi]MBY8826596.1 Atxe2 family lasso peptide isopeptidase [Hephaestia mangrovi]
MTPKPLVRVNALISAIGRLRALRVIAFAIAGFLALTIAAHANSVSPRALVEVADIGNPVVSPDGKLVAFRVEQASIERNTYDSLWYVQDTGGRFPPRRIADGGIPLRDSAGISLPAAAFWSPDSKWIYFRALMAGRVAVWRAAADGSRAEPVTQNAADVRDMSVSADGEMLRVSFGATREEVRRAEKAEYDRGIRIDARIPIGQSLFRSGYIGGKPETQRYGPIWFDRVPLLASVPSRWEAIELNTGQAHDLATSYAPPRTPTADEILPDASALAIDDKGRIALLRRVGQAAGMLQKPGIELVMLPEKAASRLIRCQAILCTGQNISGIQWRPGSDEVLFTVTDPNEGLAQSIYRWNVRSGNVEPVVRSRGLINGGRDRASHCGSSSDVLICVTSAAEQPPRLERVDLTTGERQVLFDPNAALAQEIKGSVSAELLRWSDAKGQIFTGQFIPARGALASPPPLFITYYNCPGFLRGGVGDEWPLASLAESGISALCINNPPGYILDGVARYNQALSGVESAIDLLASEGRIDRTRVGMGGLSFGSEVTLWTEMKSDLLAAASVTSPGITSNYYLFGSLKGKVFFDGLKKDWQLGAPRSTSKRWKALAEENNLASMQAPILMQMPEQEYIMALNYAIPLIRAHKADLYVFPNEPHQKFQPRHKLAAYERNLDWFRFWLQGYEDSSPEKAGQYKIWERMRTVRYCCRTVPR